MDNNTLVPRGSPGHDRLGKVRPLIDHLASRFTEMYEPHCEVSVDEAMIKFQGRFSLKEYMPLKPTKRGITVRSPALYGREWTPHITNKFFSRSASEK